MAAGKMNRLGSAIVVFSTLVALACFGALPALSAETIADKVLSQFTAADVPKTSPNEADPGKPFWLEGLDPAAGLSANANLPGKGIAQHPMLYAGELYNKLFLVNNGQGSVFARNTEIGLPQHVRTTPQKGQRPRRPR